jgi:multiple sugar transport system permease protein
MTAQQAAEGVPAAAKRDRPPAKAKRVGGRLPSFWLFVGPFLAGMLFFVFVPLGWGFLLSFYKAVGTVTPNDFVGFQNYAAVLHDSNFTGSLVTFSLFALFIVPLTFFLSLELAILVNQLNVARAFFRSVFFLPTACSYVVASLVWKLSLFNGVRFGLANTILGAFGHAPIAWLSTVSPPWYWVPLVTVRLWLQLGFYMILFIAGLLNIPDELYEASYVDGAKPGWQTFRSITFPQLRPMSIAVLLLLVIGAYQAFDEFYNLIGNADFARPPLVYLYYTALGASQDYGKGSAGAFILTLIIVVVTLLQAKVFGFGKSAADR